MHNLLVTLPAYFIWLLAGVPKKLLTITGRFLKLTNSHISLTLNLRLLFTPLFGDYTLVGRITGFFTRVFEIFFGTLIMLVISVVMLLLPLVWWGTLLLLAVELKLLFLVPMAIFFLLWWLSYKKKPTLKVSQLATNDAASIQRTMQSDCIEIVYEFEHLQKTAVVSMITHQKVKKLLERCEAVNKEFLEKLMEAPLVDLGSLYTSSLEYARKHDTRYIEVEHLFLGYISCLPKIDSLLAMYGMSKRVFEVGVEMIVSNREELSKLFIWQDDYELLFTGGTGKGMTGRVTPYLDSVSTDFTLLAKRGRLPQLVGRDKEVDAVANILDSSKVNVLILGEPGSGKTTMIKGLAAKIILGTDYRSLKNKRIVSLELSGLISGTKSAGEVAEKVKNIMRDVTDSGDIILFIDEIHTLVAGSGDQNAETSTLFSVLEKYLSEGNIQFIGATTNQNYRKFIEPNGSFSRLFQLVQIPEASSESTIKILQLEASQLEKKYDVLITVPAIVKIVELSKKLIHERVLPDKAVDILNRTCSKNAKRSLITSSLVEAEIAELTNIPVESVSSDEKSKLLNIENSMESMVVGQSHAIKQVGAALKRARTGIRNENKPIASFLFVGTTGVGKTQTAKALAKFFFGSKNEMIRLDMSEYQQLDSLYKLIGTNDGQVRGLLTEKVRTRPFALILLDEIEKAHQNILLTFLQVLDEGRLTDSTGLTIDFTNTIIIATSNVGTKAIQQIFERQGSTEEMTSVAMEEVRQHFAPEFLNRFSGIIVFNPLTPAAVQQIVELLLQDVKETAQQKGITLEFSPELKAELMIRGYNPQWGARPMARLIEDSIETYVATKLLANEFLPGGSYILGKEVFSVI